MKVKTFFPKINASGSLKMSDQEAFYSFLKDNEGLTVRMTLEIIPQETSNKLYFYYRYYVLTEVRKGFHSIGYALTPDETHLQLVHNYTDAMYYVNNEGEEDVLNIRKAGNSRMILFLEQVKMFAAKNLNTIINDPK